MLEKHTCGGIYCDNNTLVYIRIDEIYGFQDCPIFQGVFLAGRTIL